MRIVVTGGYGFIGSSFVNYAARQGHDILVVDKLTYAADMDNVTVDHDALIEDICNVTAEDLGEYEYLVNFAAESHVDNSITNGRPFVRSNVEGVFNLIEVARQNPNLNKFVQISTDEVYGDVEFPHESTISDGLHPSSYYSATKASADMLIQSAGRTFGLPYLITRTCNNFGVNQHHEKFIPVLTDCFRNDTPIPLYGDGKQVREWIWVEDNVRAIYVYMMYTNEQLINIGSGIRCSNRTLISMMEDHFGKKAVFDKTTKDRLGHDRRYALKTTHPINITKTLKDYIEEL